LQAVAALTANGKAIIKKNANIFIDTPATLLQISSVIGN